MLGKLKTKLAQLLIKILPYATKFVNLLKLFLNKIRHVRKQTVKKLAPFAFGALVVIVPVAYLLLNNTVEAEAGWWVTDTPWQKRHRLNLTNNSSENFAAGNTVSITVNTMQMYSNRELNADCSDLRILYQPNNNTQQELSRHVVFENDGDCTTSDATRVYFPLQANLNSGSSTRDYYVYYSNTQATSPSSQIDAYDISSVNALFACEFRGNANCVNSNGAVSPNTESGAVRFMGSKSALNFDGTGDYASAADSTSLSITDNLTVEAWVKLKQVDVEQTIVGKWDETTGTDNRSYRLYITSGNKFAFEISTDGTSATVTTITGSTTTASKGSWYHVAGVYNANNETLDLYVNGISDNTQVGSAGGEIDDNSSLLYIGGKENTSGIVNTLFMGILDEIRISNTIRYSTNGDAPESSFITDFNTMALYHMDEAGSDPRANGTTLDATTNNNDATLNGPTYVSGMVGIDGPSEFGSHTGANNSATLVDTNASWAPNEWVGYIVNNSTDASHGTITANTVNTITATLAGGEENDFDTGDLYALSPDLGKEVSQSFASRNGVFVEEATTNLIDNPSFENTTYDTSWSEGSGSGVIIATTRATANTGGGTQDITTSKLGGNTPKAVLIIATDTTTDGLATAGMSYSYGAATGTSNQWVSWQNTSDATTSNHRSAIETDNVICNTPPNVTVGAARCAYGQAAFSQFITNGVRLQWDTLKVPASAFYITVVFFAGSDVSAHANSFSLGDTTNGSVTTTAPGFQFDLLYGATTKNGYNVFNGGYGFAHFDGSTITQRAYIHHNRISAQSAWAFVRNDAIAGEIRPDTTGDIDYRAEVTNVSSTGFTIRTTGAGGNNTPFVYLALDFGDTVDSWVGTHSTPTSTGNYSDTGPGFTPQYTLMIPNYVEALNTKADDAKAGSFGFSVIDALNQYSNSYTFQDATSPSNTSSLANNKAVHILSDNQTTSSIQGDFVSFDTAAGWTTNYTAVTGNSKRWPAASVQSITYLTRTIETVSPYVKFGSRAAKIAASADTTLVNSVSIGASPSTHTMSLYAYLGTSGSEGGTIDNTIARILWEGTSQASTSYEDVGGGWWRLTYSATPTASTTSDFGVWLAEGETIYVDGFMLEEKPTASTYTDGSLGAGYSWSGTINESSSSRAAADIDYTASGNIDASKGSISFWLKPNWDGDDGVEHTFFDVDTASTFKIYKTSSNVLTFTDGTNTATTSTTSWNKGDWHHIVATWTSGDMDIYVDASAGTDDSYSAPTLGTNFYIGQNKSNTSHASAVISNLRIYDSVLSSAQITDLYHSNLYTFEQEYFVEAFIGDKGQDPITILHMDEAYGTTVHDASQYRNDFGLSGASWVAESSVTGGTLRTRYINFDGTNDYLINENTEDFRFGTDSFSISGWFRHPITVPDGGTTDTILAHYDTTGYKIYMNSSGQLCFGIDNDSTWSPTDTICSTMSYADSTWHHFSAVKTGTSSIAIYIDSTQVGQNTSLSATASLSHNKPMYIGIDSNGSSNPWEGDLDEIRIYSYARSEEQIKIDFAGSFGVAFGTGIESQLQNGLVAHWKMDENTGTTLSDSSGNANNSQNFSGNTTWAPGRYGSGLLFDGNNDAVLFNETPSTDLGALTDSYTVSTWFKTTTNASSTVVLVNKGVGAASPMSLELSDTEVAQFRIFGGGNSSLAVGSAALNDGKWHLITGVRDVNEDKVFIYVDGELAGLTTDTLTSSAANDSQLSLGAAEDLSGDFTGTMDDTRIYNRALSASEVQMLYQYSAAPVGYWDFNVGTGTVAQDVSNNKNDGTLTGMVSWIPGIFGSGIDTNTASSGVEITDPPGGELDFDADDSFTWMGWVKTTNIGTSSIFLQKGRIENSVAGYRARVDTFGRASCGVSNAVDTGTTQISGTSVVADGMWHHVTCVDIYTGNASPNDRRLLLYVDGVLENSLIHSEEISNSTENLNIGHINAATYWQGQIDEVKIYNYARTPEEIIKDMNAGHPTPGSPIGSALGHWKFDEGYSNIAHDSGILGKNGTITNATWSNDAKLGKSLNLDGTGDFVQVGDDDSYSFGNGTSDNPFTISAWINKNSTGGGDIVSKFTLNGVHLEYRLINPSGKDLEFILYDDSSTSNIGRRATSKLPDISEWVHIVGTYNGNGSTSGIRLYINGVRSDDTNIINGTYTAMENTTAPLAFGAISTDGTPSSDIPAKLDDIRIYTSEFSQSQIDTLYNLGFAQLLGATGSDLSGRPTEYCPPGEVPACTAPIAEWKLDENLGISAFDTSGNGITGTLGGDGSGSDIPVWRPGKVGQSLLFDGVDDFISMGDPSSGILDFGISSAFTISLWVKTDIDAITDTYPLIISKEGGSPRNGYNILANLAQYSNNWTGQVFAGGTQYNCDSLVDITDGKWHHLAFKHVFNLYATYTDGKMTNICTLTNSNISNSMSFHVGTHSVPFTGSYFNGQIDNIRVYNYTRTPAQTAWEYNHGAPGAHWKFDECSGTTANDSSVRNYRGTINAGGSGSNTSAGTCGGSPGTMWSDGAAGKHNASLEFDGTNDYVSVGDVDYFDLSHIFSTYTFTGWFKRSSFNTHDVILSKDSDIMNSAVPGYSLYITSDDVVKFSIKDKNNNLTSVTGSSLITDSEWYHVALVFFGNGTNIPGISLYINGKLEGENTAGVWLYDSSNNLSFTIGAESDGNHPFHGQIDDVRLFYYGLTPDQIKTVMNNGAVNFMQ